MEFMYPAEKFEDARRCLMLPHPQGEEVSIADAFEECSLGLMNIQDDDLDDNSRIGVAKIRDFMDTSGIQASSDKWVVKAKQLTLEEKFELSQLVDELAYWFDSRSEDNDENEA